MNMGSKTILDHLSKGLVIGDGGFCRGLENRGYVTAGSWTPECVVRYPEVVKQYHRDFLRSGADVMQAFTFFASEAKFSDIEKRTGIQIKEAPEEINMTACHIAREVADEGDAFVSGSLCQSGAYVQGKGKEFVQEQFRKQFFQHVEEIEWAIEVAKETGLPVAASMSIDPIGDMKDVPTGECAIRMTKAGADIVGVNCIFDLAISLQTIQVMKQALDNAGLHPYLVVQPYGYHTPDIMHKKTMTSLPESPFAMESRWVTRYEVAKWARDCYDLGVRYIGGCCGFEPYHIRAISEELWKERGKKCQVTQEHGFLINGLNGVPCEEYKDRLTEEYWKNLKPSSGRPYSSALSVSNH